MADEVAEALAEAVDGDFEGAGAEVELGGGVGLGEGGGAGGPALEEGEGGALAAGSHRARR